MGGVGSQVAARPSGYRAMFESTVSVAMCCYNMAAFVEEQLDSIARQTRLPDELVVCDDGSQDGSMDILRAFAAKAPFQVTVVQNEEQLGCNQNFEKAISLCRGDIIFLSDHDDVWRPHKIQLILDLMQDSSVGAAFGNAAVVGADLAPLGFTLWDTCNFNPERRVRFAAGQQFPELIANNVIQGAAAAFRSSFRSSFRPIPPEWPHDYWIALIVSALSRIEFTEQLVLDYRQHGANLLGAGKPVRVKPPSSRLRRFPRQVGHWVEKIRSPIDYYGRRLAPVMERLQSLLVLRNHLAQLDRQAVDAAMAVVSNEIEQRRQVQESIEKRMRRWT
jgi:glycosyltransferase involved in cell wall biosynthesis